MGGTINAINHNTKAMSKSIFVSLACILPCVMLSVYPLNRPLHYQIASDRALKGKGKDGQCMDYAVALSSRLAAKGIHGQLIFYRWHIRNTTTNGSHVFVAYRLSDGSKGSSITSFPHPKAVPVDASRMQLVYLLGGSATAPVEVKLQEGLNELSFFRSQEDRRQNSGVDWLQNSLRPEGLLRESLDLLGQSNFCLLSAPIYSACGAAYSQMWPEPSSTWTWIVSMPRSKFAINPNSPANRLPSAAHEIDGAC